MRSLNMRSHITAIAQRSFTPHGLEAEENGILAANYWQLTLMADQTSKALLSRMPHARTYAWLLLVAALAAGCSTQPARPLSAVPQASPTRSGHLTLASWYGPGFNGQRTSSGQIFQENKLTAASRTLPLGSETRVTNLNNGKSVVVRINDRGPYVHGRGIDLSEGAAREIGLTRKGVARVRLTSLDEPPPTIRGEHRSWSRRVRVRRRTHHRARSRALYGSRSRPIGANPAASPPGRS
jgi:rare lipoprotein A (peptidoglycan hydrolase)